MNKRRFNKEDWLTLGMEQLSAHGPDAMKLEAICRAAGLTRGSFYHHFADHESFLVAMTEHWFASQSQGVAKVLDADLSAADGAAALTEAALMIDYRLELGIRELARRKPTIHDIVAKADQFRLNMVKQLYLSQFNLSEELAEDYATIEYAVFCGIILLEPDMSIKRQSALAALYQRAIEGALSEDADR